jgi:phenylacetate-CoA ligase
LQEVCGRTTDFIVRPDGTIMHALALIYVLREIPGIKQFKILQKTLTDFSVSIVRTDNWQDEYAQKILLGLKQRLGQAANLHLEYLEEIPTEPSGKFRYVVSQIHLERFT